MARNIRMIQPNVKRLDPRTARPAPKVGDPFYYSKQWRALLDELFAERGKRCEDPQCKSPNGPWKQIYGDHIVEMKDGGAPLDKRNILLRCPSCHTLKTQRVRAERMATRY